MTIVDSNTPLICVETGEYPIYLPSMGQRQVGSFGPTIDSSVLEELGYSVVYGTPVPVGVEVSEAPPELIKGKWRQVWVERSFNPEDESSNLQAAKDQCFIAIRALRGREFTIGFPYQFPGRDDKLHVQMGGQDRPNLWELRSMAKEAIKQKDAEWTVEFRVYENIEIPMTAEEMAVLGDLAWNNLQKAYKVSWAFKNKVAKATTLDELPVLPETLF